jgi:hypothetical protein
MTEVIQEGELHGPTSNKGFDGRVKLKKHDGQATGRENWIDVERSKLQAYEYLCHIGEAKESDCSFRWIEACIKQEIGQTEKLDEELRNGIHLARLAKFFHPQSVKKIFEVFLLS